MSNNQNNTPIVLRFEDVTFEFGENKPILKEGNFSIRQGSKITIMGQNGAGKSTIFKMITKDLHPEEGEIHIAHNRTIAIARQVIPRDDMSLTVKDFFLKSFKEKIYDIDPRIDEILEVVNLKAPHDRIVKTFSGGQQARLLLASALIQKPDILLLDEPTNNLDHAGIEHLTTFLKQYKGTCLVISHDADFLNSFTDGVLYLDARTQKIEQYVGNYFDVVEQIRVRVEKENMKNAQLAKEIQENKDKANFFANKGGQMRLVAKRMREKAEELEEEKVDVRKEDKTIKEFTIPHQPDFTGVIVTIAHKNKKIELKRNKHLRISGPNGIGKSTLLSALVENKHTGSSIADGIRVGYYRQDFSTLNFDHTVFQTLEEGMRKSNKPLLQEKLRAVAASFLITAEYMQVKVGSLSEGQKGLVAFARLVLEEPGLLILDEPTNHINFRHLPVIAKALHDYEGAMIIVSHVPEFLNQIRIDETLDLSK
jgi:ATPase subunit of ABC transporter with duplicated ATPase domains